MILWLIAVCAGLAAMAAIACRYWIVVRRYRRMTAPDRQRVRGKRICFYLDDELVMNLYLQGDYKALKREVEERTHRNTERGGTAQVRGVGVRAERTAEEEKVIKYLKDEGPITVVNDIIASLEKTDDIVYVDLINKSFEPGGGLDRALWAAHGQNNARRRSARLDGLDAFVWVKGRFQKVDDAGDETITFVAPYGAGADLTRDEPKVSITCVAAQLQLRRDRVPQSPFSARCLGLIRGWESENRKLVIHPIVIFQ